MELKWESPPAPARPGRGRGIWADIADALRARPGEWALVREEAAVSTTTSIKNGLMSGMAAGEFDARSVSTGLPTGRAKIYARYIGDANA